MEEKIKVFHKFCLWMGLDRFLFSDNNNYYKLVKIIISIKFGAVKMQSIT